MMIHNDFGNNKDTTEEALREQVADARAKLELAHEYFTNDKFRKALQDWCFEQTYKPGKRARG